MLLQVIRQGGKTTYIAALLKNTGPSTCAYVACSLKPSVQWVAASDLEDESARLTPQAHASACETIKNCSCILIPGGFGDRGVPGMILVANYGSRTHMGSTMRLGSRRTFFQDLNCISSKLYGNSSFMDERHRHRYEITPTWRPALTLKEVVEDRISKDGVLGTRIVATTVGLFLCGIVVALVRKR